MSYYPRKSVQIINICCSLSNICNSYNICDQERNNVTVENEIEGRVPDNSETNGLRLLNDAIRIRNEISRGII